MIARQASAHGPPSSAATAPASVPAQSPPGPPSSTTQMLYASANTEMDDVTPTTLSSQPMGCLG